MSRDAVSLALDLGTTSLAGALLAPDGERLAVGQLPNPQTQFGNDVLRRLEAARDGKGKELQALQVAAIDALVNDLCVEAGVARSAIAVAAAAANPAITTLLRNIPADPILFPPYRPEDVSATDFDLQAVGLDGLPPLFLFSLVNGFVGGDLVAFLFSQPEPKLPTLYIDIGTNGEIALFFDGRWWVTSVAAGPAFEGSEIGSGMLYGPGAIEGCRIGGDRLLFDVVDNVSPQGICGTGLVETIAAALEAGLIDAHGSIVDPAGVTTNHSRYIIPHGDGFALQLYRDAKTSIILEQKDIRNFQLAKAAIYAGVDCLLKKAGIEVAEITKVVMTGAFGFSLSRKALKKVAMLPENMVDNVRFEASGALNGVCRMLMAEDGSGQVEALARRLKPYPLSGTPTFEKAFIKSIDF